MVDAVPTPTPTPLLDAIRVRAEICVLRREFYGEVETSPACGGNGTIHRGCIIGDAHDTIPPRRVRIHTTTLTYSHQIRHSTRIFAHEHPRAAQRHAPDALSGLSTARDDPRAGPDRPGAGAELPGVPDTAARTWAARAAPYQHMGVPEKRASGPRATAPPAGASASSAPSTPPTPPRAAPLSLAAAAAVPAAQSRCTCAREA